MLVERDNTVTVQSTMQGEKVKMGIDEFSMAHIMSILTDLYSDPELAVIREYSTNALDAHVEVGQTRPIEVSTPTHLSPFFKVKDYGVGLSVEEITEIYSKYGASTKRDTNDQVGMLGLGCKSALAYVSQFTLVGVKNGERVAVAISRDEDGAGSMTVVETNATDEPSGVEIVIPARKYSDLHQKSLDFFKYWAPGTVLLNGEEPIKAAGLDITDNIKLVLNARNRVVMGNVAYPMPNEYAHQMQHNGNWGVVAYVNIGDVNFTPSREALMMTGRTKATLEAIKDAYNGNIEAAGQKIIDKCETPNEALKTLLEYLTATASRINEYSRYSYKGETVPDEMVIASPIVVPRNSHRQKEHSKYKSVPTNLLTTSVFFHNYQKETFTAYSKRKIEQWAVENGIQTPRHYILTNDKPDSAWIDSSRVYDWDEVAAVKLPQVYRAYNGGPTRLKGSYDLLDDGEIKYEVAADKIDTSKPLLYFIGNKHSLSRYQFLDGLIKKYTVVALGQNRINKFERDFPKAKRTGEYIKDRHAKWLKKIENDGSKMILIINNNPVLAGALREIDASRVDDPAIAKAVKVMENGAKIIKEANTFANLLHYRSWMTNDERDYKSPFAKYPLFDTRNLLRHPEDTYIYLNAAYAARKEVSNDAV